MSKNKNTNISMDPFQQWSHSKGRIGTLIALIYMVCIPSVAVAVSSIMTVIILAIAALLSSRIEFIFEIPEVKTASNYIIPALFGSLTLGLFSSSSSGDKVVKGGIKGVIPVLVLTTIISLVVRITSGGSLFGAIGFLIIAMLPIAIITSRIMWKKGKITVIDNPSMNKK